MTTLDYLLWQLYCCRMYANWYSDDAARTRHALTLEAVKHEHRIYDTLLKAYHAGKTGELSGELAVWWHYAERKVESYRWQNDPRIWGYWQELRQERDMALAMLKGQS